MSNNSYIVKGKEKENKVESFKPINYSFVFFLSILLLSNFVFAFSPNLRQSESVESSSPNLRPITISGGGNINNFYNNTYNINGSLIYEKLCSALGSDYVLQDFDNSTGQFTCTQITGTGTGFNNYTYGLSVTGNSTKNLTLFIKGGPNISTTFTDNTGDDIHLVSVTTTNGTTHLFQFALSNGTTFIVPMSDTDFNSTGLILNWSTIGDSLYSHINLRLNELADPNASKVFNMDGSDIEWLFTNPNPGMVWNFTGGWSGHVLQIRDHSNVPTGSPGDHLLHIESDRQNVVGLHVRQGNSTETAIKVDSGIVNISDNATLVANGSRLYNVNETDPIWITDKPNYATTSYTNSLNDSNNNYITQNNNSIVNWALSTFVSSSAITQIYNFLGLYYENTTQLNLRNDSINNHIIEVNTSMKNYVDSQNTSQTNYINDVNTSNNNYISSVNTSMKNYVDSQDLAYNNSNNNYIAQNNNSVNNGYTAQDNSYNTSNNNYALDLNNSNNNYIAQNNNSIVNWALSTFVSSSAITQVYNFLNSYYFNITQYEQRETTLNNTIQTNNNSITNTFGNYYTKTEIDAQNTSQTNYINSNNQSITNTFSSYATTAYANGLNDSQNNARVQNNNSINNYIVDYGNSLNTSNNNYIAQNNNSVINYIGSVNTSMKNYVDSQNTALNNSNNNYIASNNQSINNYILYVNSTNGAGSGGNSAVHDRQLTDIYTASTTTFVATDISYSLASAKNYTLTCVLIFNGSANTIGQAINLSTPTPQNINQMITSYETWSSNVAKISFSSALPNQALVGTGSGAGVWYQSFVVADITTNGTVTLTLGVRAETAGSSGLKRGSYCDLLDVT